MLLADSAIAAGDLTLLGEAFRGSSTDTRKQFAALGGDEKLKDAFGEDTDEYTRAHELTSVG